MTDTKQPEALRLDAQIDRRYPEHCRTSCSDAAPCNYDIDGTGCHRCNAFFFTKAEANEARIAALEAENSTLKSELEAIGAGGVTGLQIPNYWRRWSAAQVERLYRNSEVARNDTKSLAVYTAAQLQQVVEQANSKGYFEGYHDGFDAATKEQAQAKREPMTQEQMRGIFLRQGFTVKAGQDDLKDYVYAAGRAIEAHHGIGDK